MTPRTPRTREIAVFYASRARRIRASVAGAVQANTETIDDACQHAWTILLRRDDVTLDDRGANWLITVAIHKVWQMVASREIPAGSFQGTPDNNDDVTEPIDILTAGTDEQALSRIENSERVVELRKIKPRERRDLYLQALGYSYREIAELTASTYTAVNRRLTEGRGRLRTAAERTVEDNSASARGRTEPPRT